MKTISYMGIPDCLVLTNGTIEAVITTSVGPRILAYRFVGGENVLGEHPESKIQTEMGVWRPYGGHRIWAAPEEMPRTYYPDNDPVHYELLGERAVRLVPPQEKFTDLQKEMRVMMSPSGTTVTIEHLIRNCGTAPRELAVWGLTIMRGGGVTILPQEPFRSHDDYLLPARPMTLWYFTDLTDPRFTIGKRLVQLSTDDKRESPQKIGILNKQGWAAYYRGDTLFVKEMEYLEDGIYPDYGCNTEAYSQAGFMELETLDIMRTLEPGETATHKERWHLFGDQDLSANEEERANAIESLLR